MTTESNWATYPKTTDDHTTKNLGKSPKDSSQKNENVVINSVVIVN